MSITTKYRPINFSEVFGQDVTVRILRNSILMDRIPKGVLFSGIRGTGKTTLARIYAKALNCEEGSGNCCGKCNSCLSNPDIIEIDAASNNGVDNIRQLSDKLATAKLGKYRVVILDECHELSGAAQSAFLKMLEEPPTNTIFLLVTTNPEKLDNTIQSRCLSMPLLPLRHADVSKNILWILSQEGYEAEEGLINSLVGAGIGSLRDIQQILEQVILYSDDKVLRESCLMDIAGIIPTSYYKDMAAAICSGDLKYFLEEINRWYLEGRDLKHLFLDGLPKLFRDFAAFLVGSQVDYYSGISEESFRNNLTVSLEVVRLGIRLVGEMDSLVRNSSHEKELWECFAVRLFEG